MIQNKPVIVIVGAGSLFFGRKAVWAVNHLIGLKGGTLRLVDTDPVHLEKMTRLGRMAAESAGSGTKVEAFSDYRGALPGADFVVLSFSERNAYYRGIDCRVSEAHGIRMCSGDTIGPGGVFRTLREFPKILDIARAVEQVCPEAWVINYVNPSAIMGIGLMRYSKAKTFALCDTHHLPFKKEEYLKLIGESPGRLKEFDVRIAGVNHFTWMLKAELAGEDVLPQIRDAFWAHSESEKDEGHSKGRFNNFITAQLGDLFGAIPTCTGHTKEYVPYYQNRAGVPEAIPALTVFDAEERKRATERMWEEIDAILDGKTEIQEFHARGSSDHATDIINTMVVEDGRNYFINRTNTDCVDGSERAVGNLPKDAFLELECMLDRNGPRPLPVGDFPLGLRSQQMMILDVHELTIEAIMTKDRGLLLRALAMDPLVNSIATADAVINALYEEQKDVLPAWVEKAEKSPGCFFSDAVAGSTGPVPQLF